MGEIRCPLCCGNTFSSKEELVDHISKHKNGIECPVCLEKCLSLEALTQHLVEDSCRMVGTGLGIEEPDSQITIHFNGDTEHSNNQNNYAETIFSPSTSIAENNEDSNIPEVGSNHDSEEQEMFVELMNKPLSEAFEMEKMQLMDALGENQYIIVSQNDVASSVSGSTIVAKQNPDGTVSIKNVEDPDEGQAEEPVITVLDSNLPLDKEVYTCNSCGFNFTSVLEHIQDFHKNEDVVVEVNEATENAVRGESKVETEIIESEGASVAAPRRMITATGCIVERIEDDNTGSEATTFLDKIKRDSGLPQDEDVTDYKGRVFTRRYVPVKTRRAADVRLEDKDVQLTEKSTSTPQKAPYHQVVMKEMVTVGGGQKIKVYYCTACHTYVSDLNDFKSHPCKFLKYTCLDCPASYETAKSLYSHMKVHNEEKKIKEEAPATPPPLSGPFSCNVCETVFISNKSLKLHKRMHMPAKGKAIEPPEEPKTDDADPTHEKYLCPLCNKWIPTGYRDVHDYFHDKCEKFNCNTCNKKFESRDYLVMHMNVHNTEKLPVSAARQDKNLPYDCSFCERRFARPHEKVKHERIHTGEKPHSCEICGKSFRVSYCLTLHMRTHTGARPYECKHCGKRFKAHSVYNHHLLTHSDVRAYKCPYCPKAFKTSVQLAGHKNSHTKPFSCNQCNRPFASLYAVRVHTETHRRQNNLKYCCTLCGASYARTFALKDHMKAVHKEEVEAAETYVNSANTVANGWNSAVVKNEKAITEFAMEDVETEETLISQE